MKRIDGDDGLEGYTFAGWDLGILADKEEADTAG
jgi:hypothetical protein